MLMSVIYRILRIASMITCVRPYFRTLGLAAVVALSGCASVLDLDGAFAIVPYTIEEDGRIVVEARVDGQGPYDFVPDTGSTISAVFDAPRDDLSLEPIPGMTVIVHGIAASGQFPLLNIGRLEVGREVWADPRIVSLPSETEATASIDGILGMDFLRRYAVGFSARDRVLRLYPPDLVARKSYRGWASIPLEAVHIGASGPVLYFVDIEIDGWKIQAVFDLGAGLNVINWPGARSLGLDPPQLREDDLMSGALDNSTVAARLSVKEVTTAGIRWRNEEFSIADVEIFETLKLRDSPAAILGASLFTQRDFIIDFVRSRLLVNVAMDEEDTIGSTGIGP
jgi:hypothetical protein